MSKYDPLGAHLRAQPATHVAMSFSEIEQVVGFALPAVAKSARAWWSNNPSNNVMTRVWRAAGFRSEQVDLAAEKLVFKRDPDQPDAESRGGGEPPASDGQPFGLFGCLKGAVRVTSGCDLTAPADAAWGEAAE